MKVTCENKKYCFHVACFHKTEHEEHLPFNKNRQFQYPKGRGKICKKYKCISVFEYELKQIIKESDMRKKLRE